MSFIIILAINLQSLDGLASICPVRPGNPTEVNLIYAVVPMAVSILKAPGYATLWFSYGSATICHC